MDNFLDLFFVLLGSDTTPTSTAEVVKEQNEQVVKEESEGCGLKEKLEDAE